MNEIIKDYCIIPDNFYPVKGLQKYVHMGVLRKYQKGEFIIPAGEKIDRVIYVVSGKVSLNFFEDKKQKIMFYACRHGVVDNLFSYQVILGNIVAEENSTVCFFSKEQLYEIFRKDDETHDEFITNLTCKCSFFMYVAKEMDFYSPSARVLRLINELCLSKGKLVNDVYKIDIKLTQKMISEITGVHSVTVCKILGWLKKEKIMRKTSDKIIIYDLQRLKDAIDMNLKYYM
ncbi:MULTISPECIES: Crp/Fnr family transcriptional regulator [unclassified Dehalobacter]|uniref:Crp/Fnr family transcriptional regulator n=1 Tax=unclassified Dehalobacter TaxID=2635733 RepID=UPI000E6BDD0D|nr:MULTISPECIES: Crp/Fnr family transcriptional regulator [unclassified Dehalobacter]RJE48533.1 Crp/Fnr family transcriptional regulator [Dehalobacter sp. MCB1]TCX53458.1 Crp/Fnr family transcriptional regulator [Dehalobacter sp. 14DCB1]TCX54807.1 Crp/Fnr family transcriptional regulator [Dehalobacter sp. 12DCB1]